MVAVAAAGTVGIPANQLTLQINTVVANPEAAPFLTDIVADSHPRLIGSGGPVQITGQQMVDIVRNQNVATLPAVTLPVETVGILDTIRTALQWVVPIAALAGLAAVVLGVIAHPERADAIFGIGVFCILAAVLAMVLGYVVPTFLLPVFTDNTVDRRHPGRRQHAAHDRRRRVVRAGDRRRRVDPRLGRLPSPQDELVGSGARRPLQRAAAVELSRSSARTASAGR